MVQNSGLSIGSRAVLEIGVGVTAEGRGKGKSAEMLAHFCSGRSRVRHLLDVGSGEQIDSEEEELFFDVQSDFAHFPPAFGYANGLFVVNLQSRGLRIESVRGLRVAAIQEPFAGRISRPWASAEATKMALGIAGVRSVREFVERRGTLLLN